MPNLDFVLITLRSDGYNDPLGGDESAVRFPDLFTGELWNCPDGSFGLTKHIRIVPETEEISRNRMFLKRTKSRSWKIHSLGRFLVINVTKQVLQIVVENRIANQAVAALSIDVSSSGSIITFGPFPKAKVLTFPKDLRMIPYLYNHIPGPDNSWGQFGWFKLHRDIFGKCYWWNHYCKNQPCVK